MKPIEISHGSSGVAGRSAKAIIGAALLYLLAGCSGSDNSPADTESVSTPTPSEPVLIESQVTQSSLVSEFASFNTPGVLDGQVEAIAVDGDTVYVGGSFTQIQNPLDTSTVITQPYLFAYSKSSGDIIQSFDPQLNNPVLALEKSNDDSGIFVGGRFNVLNGESNRRGLVKLNKQGDRVFGFGARPDAQVKTLKRHGDTLYVGGNFDTISGTPIDKLAALDTTTGTILPTLNLNIDGTISTSVANGVQSVDVVDVTSDGQLMVVVGNFTEIDGISRSRLALIELNGQASVSSWNTDVFDTQCPTLGFPQYILGVDIAPDDSYFVTGTTGFRRPGDPACDTIIRFELDDLSNGNVEPTWINYTGGDSVFEVVAAGHAVYAGGHFRWLNNDTTADGHTAGPGSVERRGLAALDPINGLTLLNWRSDRNPRGQGTFALVVEDEGLYIGDDTDFLNGTEHRKLKFLPISSETINRPGTQSLPASIITTTTDRLDVTSFDGATLGATNPMHDSGWQDSTSAVLVGDQLIYTQVNGLVWMSRLSNGILEPRVPIDLFGLTANEWDIARITGMFFDHDRGRIYYTQRDDSRLLWRAFSPSSPYFGNDEFVADNGEQGDVMWGDINGMDIIDGHLYFVRSDEHLYRAGIDGAKVTPGTTQAISGPSIDGRAWRTSLLTFLSE